MLIMLSRVYLMSLKYGGLYLFEKTIISLLEQNRPAFLPPIEQHQKDLP